MIDYTILHTPQLNRKSEKLNLTIIKKARALIADSGLKKEMWGEAVLAATYLINRSPTANQEETPFEKWTGTRPDLSRLQVFVSKVFAKNLGHLKKLEDRRKPYIFIGYATNRYRLFDENKRLVIISRDVVLQTQLPQM